VQSVRQRQRCIFHLGFGHCEPTAVVRSIAKSHFVEGVWRRLSHMVGSRKEGGSRPPGYVAGITSAPMSSAEVDKDVERYDWSALSATPTDLRRWHVASRGPGREVGGMEWRRS
jgi:hypothetical protein